MPNRSVPRTWLLTSIVFVIAALGMGTASFQLERSEQRHVADNAQVTATLSAGMLQNYIRARSLAGEMVRRGVQSGELKDEGSFVTRTTHVQEQFGGYRAINFVDQDGFIRYVSPKETNAGAVGKSVLDHPDAASTLRAVMRDRLPRATGPLTLFQGGRGFAAYLPVSAAPASGYVNVVFDATTLVERCFGSHLLNSEALRLTDQGAVMFESPDFQSSPGASARATLEVFDRTWLLELRARRSNVSAHRHPWIHALAFLVAVGIALAVNLVLRRSEERERTEHVQRVLAERVQNSTTLEAVGQLAGGVAHDFNNLLTVVASNVQLLRDHPDRTDPELMALDEIEAASQRGSELTTQLLAFSRKQVVVPRAVDVDAAVMHANTMLRRVLRENIEIKLEFGPDVKSVVIDPGQLDRALVNLALNAGDAMPHGGLLTLRTQRSDDQISIEVEDTGEGMTPEVITHAFEPFFTTKPVGKGTGLGLATVYGVVTQAGGEISVDSEPGSGTKFRILLPRSEQTPVSEPHLSSSARLVKTAGTTVLLVEDDPAVRRGAVRTLQRAGYVVVEAANGRIALELFDAEIDVVATDAVMPEMGGRALIEALRQRRPKLAVVLMSGHAPDVLGDTLEHLDVEYLAKPYTPAQLADALARAVLRQTTAQQDEVDPQG